VIKIDQSFRETLCACSPKPLCFVSVMTAADTIRGGTILDLRYEIQWCYAIEGIAYDATSRAPRAEQEIYVDGELVRTDALGRYKAVIKPLGGGCPYVGGYRRRPCLNKAYATVHFRMPHSESAIGMPTKWRKYKRKCGADGTHRAERIDVQL
jgi:hypothetical protein